MHRFAIMYLKNQDGDLPQYVRYVLESLKKIAERIEIVSLNAVTYSEKEHIKLERTVKNSEEAYLYVINRLKEEILFKYDELICIDDSFFGPFKPFEEIFSEMKGRECDFWSLSFQPAMIYQETEWEDSLEEGFLVLRKNMLFSEAFWEYCDKGCCTNFYGDMTESGWKAGFYFGDLWKKEKVIQNYKYYDYKMLDMIERGYPVLPCRKFKDHTNMVYDMPEILAFIDKNYDYDTAFIWEYILKHYYIGDVKDALKADYILPSGLTLGDSVKERKVLVIVHFYYEQCLKECIPYVKRIPEYIDICFTSSQDSILAQVLEVSKMLPNRVIIKKVDNRGRDISALLIGCKQIVKMYDYFCFIHDKKTSSEQPAYIWELFQQNMWENNLKSKAYIENIIYLLDCNEHLGVLVPPAPKHGLYRKLFVDGWSGTFDETKRLLKRLGIDVPLEEGDQPFAFSSSFWCKTKALIPLLEYDFQYEDFPEEPMPATGTVNHAVERVFPYVAQWCGYYTGVVECDTYASMEIILMRDVIKELLLERNTLNSHNKQLREQKDEIGKRNIILKEETEKLGKRNLELKKRSAAVLDRNKELKNQIDEVSTRNVELKEQLEATSIRNEELKGRLETTDSQNKELKSRINVVLARNAELKEQQNAVQAFNRELKREIAEVNNMNKNLKVKIDTFGNYNKDLKQKIEEYRNRLDIQKENNKENN